MLTKFRSIFLGPLPCLIGAFIAAVFIGWIVFAHQNVTDKLEYLDYCNSFYIAGLLCDSGSFGQIYPTIADRSFQETAFNKFAHTIVNHLPAHFDFTFMYPPLIALIFAPLSLLPMRTALILWQFINLAALALSAFIAAKLPQVDKPAANLFFVSFLSLPLLHVLVFGQVSIIFGLLPLVGGYLLWLKRRDFLAGVAWAFLSMKLQLFVPVALVTFACLVSSYWRSGNSVQPDKSAKHLTAGMITGLILYHGLPLLFLGPEAFCGWLRILALAFNTTHVASQPWAYHLTISLSNAILFLTPSHWRETTGMVSKLASMLGACTAAIVLLKISLNKTLPESSKKERLIIVSCLFLPLIAPYLRIYDCTLLILPSWFIFFRNNLTKGFEQTTFSALLSVWIALDLYIVSIFIIGKEQMVIPQIGLLLVLIAACWHVSCAALMTKQPTIDNTLGKHQEPI